MKVCKVCSEIKTLDMFYSHKTNKDRKYSNCKQCFNEASKARDKANPEKKKAKNKREYAANPKRLAEWARNNPEAKRAYEMRWAANNSEKRTASSLKWAKTHPAKKNAANAKRRAARLDRTPKWLTRAHLYQIGMFYDAAQRLTANFGVRHVVDHIIPLQGDIISGLHVPWNLQVITESENCSKGNKCA